MPVSAQKADADQPYVCQRTIPVRFVGVPGVGGALPDVSSNAPRSQTPSEPGRCDPAASTLKGAASVIPLETSAIWLARRKLPAVQFTNGLGAPVGTIMSLELVPDLGVPEFK